MAASTADIAPAILQTYFRSYPGTRFLSKHHIESYDSFIFDIMPNQIFSQNPITILKEPIPDQPGKYVFKTEIYIGGKVNTADQIGIKITPPILELDSGRTIRRMFPNDARLRNTTYESTLVIDVDIHVTITQPTAPYTSETKIIKYENMPLFTIPILLGSKLCATHGANAQLLFEMGECRNDPGGYFIVNGSEKVLVSRLEQANNSVVISLHPPHDLKIHTHASVACQHPKTKQTRTVKLIRLRNDTFGNGKITERSVMDGAIRVSIPSIKNAIPLFVLFRALGVESDEQIIRMILPDANAPMTAAMEETLIACIYDARPIATQAQAIELMRILTNGFIPEAVLEILNETLFMHVPNQPLARAKYLAEVVYKMIRVEMRLEPQTNRDDIRNQRLLTTGSLLSDLFINSFGVWRDAIIKKVDETYNYNKTMYGGNLIRPPADTIVDPSEGDKFLIIFNPSNIKDVLNGAKMTETLMRGFRGKWGTDPMNIREGVIQPLARLSYLDTISHTRRVVTEFDTSMKLTGPRHLNPSQIGYFCTSETPQGAHIGVTKNMSILTGISVPVDIDPILSWLQSRGEVIPVGNADIYMTVSATTVQINGGSIGYCTDPVKLLNVLKLMKWTACLSPTCSISFNTAENVIRLYFDEGRPIRPLWHLYDSKPPSVPAKLPTWNELVCGTLNEGAVIPSSKFIDPLASTPAVNLDSYLKFFHANMEKVGFIEYIDAYEGNESYISWWGKDMEGKGYTHAEIHPCSLMGVVANMIPFANHNQSPRNQLSCSQSKQGIGHYATNYENRFDTYGSMLCYGEGALARTIVHEALGDGGMSYGTNIIFAFACFDGYNQDDGILFNRTSIERGLFRSLAFRSYSTQEEEDPISGANYVISNPSQVSAWTDLKMGADYSQLDENGIIREKAVIHDKTVLVARYLKDPNTGVLRDASLMPTVFTKGRVDKVVVLHQNDGRRIVHVRILEERIPELGDKFSTRHGQKGTMGMMLDAQDMPRTADGMVPDVIVNPHCIPSRMTIAQLLEQVFGKFGAIAGAKMNATTFMNDQSSYSLIASALEELGLNSKGEEILYSGITGKMFTSSVFMGPLYFMRLKHLTSDKVNSRSAGRKEMRTHQPTGGRGNEGGMRMGEMERDSVITHGMTEFLKESYMKRSDGTTMWICNGCGQIPIYNEDIQLFICPACDGPLEYHGNSEQTLSLVVPIHKSRTTFSHVEIPYALKLMDQELQTYASMGMRFVTEKHARRFREPIVLNTLVEEEVSKSAETGGLFDLLSGIVGGTGAATEKEVIGNSNETESKQDKLQEVVETLSRQINELNERLTVARLPTEQLETGTQQPSVVPAVVAAAPQIEAVVPVAVEEVVNTNTNESTPQQAGTKPRLPVGAAAPQPMPPTEADVLLTHPNIANTIQENEAAAAAIEAAKQAAAVPAVPTTVNVVLNPQQQMPAAPVQAPVQAQQAVVQAPLPPAPVPAAPIVQSGGATDEVIPGMNQPTLQFLDVSVNEGVNMNIEQIPQPDESEVKVLSVSAFEPAKK
jgi:DNA-directed RNA polymerase II subunit RPB2